MHASDHWNQAQLSAERRRLATAYLILDVNLTQRCVSEGRDFYACFMFASTDTAPPDRNKKMLWASNQNAGNE